MTKRRAFDGTALTLPGRAEIALPDAPPKRGKRGGVKPIASIGTMQRDTTPDQRRVHHKLKMALKEKARQARYEQGLIAKEGAGKA